MKKAYLSNKAPGENILSENLVMETGCICMFVMVVFVFVICVMFVMCHVFVNFTVRGHLSVILHVLSYTVSL